MTGIGLSKIFPLGRKIVFWMLALLSGVLIGYMGAEGIIPYSYLILLLIVGCFTIHSVKISFALFIFSLPLAGIGAFPSVPSIKASYILFLFFIISLVYNYGKDLSKGKEKSGVKRSVDDIRKEIIERTKTIIDLPLIIFLGVIILSVFQSQYIPANPYIIGQSVRNFPWIKSVTKILLLLGCIAVYYACVYFLNTKEKIKSTINIYIFCATLFSLFGIASMLFFKVSGNAITLGGFETIVKVPNELPRVLSVEQEPLFFGFYLLTILPVLYVLLIKQISKMKMSFPLMFAAIAMTVAMLLTQSRSAILGFFVSLLAIFFLFKEKRSLYQHSIYCFIQIYKIFQEIIKRISSSRVKTVLIIFLLITMSYQTGMHHELIEEKVLYGIEYGIVNPVVGTFDSSRGKYWSTKTRLIMYQFAIDAFEEHPILGVGYENYNFYSGHQYYYGLYEGNINWPEVNNYPLKVLAELGLIGFAVFIFLMIAVFYFLIGTIRKTKEKFSHSVLVGYTASFAGIATLLLFSSNITKPYLWVSLAVAIATIQLVNREEK
jgi:O-antigen ligase